MESGQPSKDLCSSNLATVVDELLRRVGEQSSTVEKIGVRSLIERERPAAADNHGANSQLVSAPAVKNEPAVSSVAPATDPAVRDEIGNSTETTISGH